MTRSGLPAATARERLWGGSAGNAKGLGLVDRVEPLGPTVERLTAPLRARVAKGRLPRS